MPTDTDLYIPTPELVAIHWIKGVPGVPVDLVATTVPERSDEFAKSGFIQVASAGGDRDIETGMRNSNITVSSWAYNPDSQKVPWGKANNLLELILAGTEEDGRVPSRAARRLTLPAQYNDARVRTVYPIGEPQRIPEEGDFARYSMTLVIVWTPVQK